MFAAETLNHLSMTLVNRKTYVVTPKRNHPRKGASIKVEPVRDMSAIEAIKQVLKCEPRNLCLFVLGINTAYRANELLSLNIKDVADLKAGESLNIKQKKTDQYRRASLNKAAINALRQWIAVHPSLDPDAPLFLSRKGGAISVARVNHLVKDWCRTIGLRGNYGSHTLRKTWGYQQRVQNHAPVPVLMRAFGHKSEAQTLEYLCIQPEEIQNLYLSLQL